MPAAPRRLSLACAVLLPAVATLAELLGSPAQEPTRVAAFHAFMKQYGRPYARGSPEYAARLALFARRAAEAEAQNALPRRLWSAGLNSLSDRTETELAQLRGWRGVAAAGGASGTGKASRGARGNFLAQRGPGRPSFPEEFLNWTSLKSAEHITNQLWCGSCWAVTTTKVLEMHQEIYHPGSSRTFSAQELVDCVPNPHQCGGSGGCMGATVELALNYIAHQGLAQEEEVPYIGLDNFCKKRLGYRDGGWLQLGGHNDGSGDSESLESLTQPGVHEVPSHSPGRHLGMHGWERLAENGYEELLRAVYETGPVAVSVAAQPWQNYMSGVFDGCRPNDVLDHAVVLVGFGKDHHSGALFYLIQNSWGKDWGEHGNIRLLRHEDDEEHCGWDHRPLEGTGCEGGPRKVKICGMCGVLYDSTVPHFRR